MHDYGSSFGLPYFLRIKCDFMSEITQAIKQICDEKGISYENVMETIKAALAAAYRKDFGNKLQNIQVEFDPETMKLDVTDVKTVVEDLPEEELEEIEGAGDGDNEVKKVLTDKKILADSSAFASTFAKATVDVQEVKKAESKIEGKEAKEEKPAEGTPPLGSALSTSPPRHGSGTSFEGSARGESSADDSEKKHFNPKTEIQLKDAKAIKKSYKVGDVIITKLEVPGSFGRMAAQTAKQVIIQKLREAERETIYNEFKGRESTILIGTVQRREGKMVLIDLGKTTALMPFEEQVPRESYVPGEHLKVYVVSVDKTTKGPGIIVSRSRPEIVKKFFEMEIPEIANGVVEIKGIAREPGSRTKIAVWTDQENIDPIGSCIGQRGARVQTIISELKGEKIDIILWSEDPEEYITHALSPAKITSISLNKEAQSAVVRVPEEQLSLAIGKGGQNVRLAARLTGWKIDIEADRGEKTATEEEKPKDGTDAVVEEKKEEADSAKLEDNNVKEEKSLDPSAELGALGVSGDSKKEAEKEAAESTDSKKKTKTEKKKREKPIDSAISAPPSQLSMEATIESSARGEPDDSEKKEKKPKKEKKEKPLDKARGESGDSEKKEK